MNQSLQLIMLPYFGGGPSEWNEVRSLLKDYSSAALSLKGVGQRGDHYSVRDAVEDVAKAVDKCASGDFVLIGHSMGGKIAMGVAARAPQGLKGLILLAPSPPTPEPIPDEIRQRMLTTHGTREAAIVTINASAGQPIIGEKLEDAIRANLDTSPTDWRNWLETGSKEDISDVLPQIHIPVLVIIGANDKGMTPDLMNREIVEKIPGAKLEIIPKSGHFLPLEAPYELAAVIGEFVGGL